MNILLLIMLYVMLADMLFTSVQTERYWMRERTSGELTATRVAALAYAVVIFFAIVLLS